MSCMVGRKLATVGCCALLFWGSQVEQAHTPSVAVSMLASNSRDLLRESGVAPRKLRDFLSTPLERPITFIHWSHDLKNFLTFAAVQKNCLTTAIYFESRSESELGQLAVAMVVMNRVQTSKLSVCGVVYKGANRINACQFSFACDGKPDAVDDVKAWKASDDISELALAGRFRGLGESMQVLTIATNYHADYVSPRWSKQITRLAKIGRHIFYTETPEVRTAANRKNYI